MFQLQALLLSLYFLWYWDLLLPKGKNVGYMQLFHSYHFLKAIILLGRLSEQKVSVSRVSNSSTLSCGLLVSQIK